MTSFVKAFTSKNNKEINTFTNKYKHIGENRYNRFKKFQK